MTICSQKSYAQKKSTIAITYPTSTTVWKIPETIEIQWNTINLDTTKSIRFFLARDEVVVQELGKFKNKGYAKGIKLAKNISSGNTYQVVGIELFPDNKHHVAKFVTPFFSIKKERPVKPLEKTATANIAAEQNMNHPIRQEFEGRKISYVKKLVFSSEHISVKIWDHEKEDGDIVSIYLNGTLVVSKHLLTKKFREFDIKLEPDKPNDLLLYAHNLGEVSPNTVSLEITDSIKSEKITLNSYLSSSEAVLISVKK
ncbi:hypothetical protein [Flagellimonas nanhaiensis]|uniref:hypothetical protein n=1 Tax=Flagellimonas nanhaiensis TaxID=2292706 RepID=UPI0011C07DF8|nr:hypothetical protein [Allomuricauda nanhaiensis]